MCGLFGVIRSTGVTPADKAAIEVVGSTLVHRGPDGSGYIRDTQFVLGMHRLSIMDVEHGWQPFWSEDKSIGVLGNGEIYNASTLRGELLDRGHILRTRSDIEVVPHMYEEFGRDFVNRLRGMFALVIVDKRQHAVILIRDRMGEKPLTTFETNGAHFFASEQTALVSAGLVPTNIEDSRLPSYLLHGYCPEPHSLLTGVVKVPAAHMLTISVETGEQELHQYWNPLDHFGSQALTTERLAKELETSISLTCTSDVPVGLALSGGLDSSMVAAVASRERIDLHAFSIGYEGGVADETAQAGQLARDLGIPMHVSVLSTQDVAQGFAEVCRIRDEPITDIAGPALAALPRAAREAGVPVLLTGVGGDELFWGYEWIRRLAQWTERYLDQSSKLEPSPKAVLRARPKTVQGLADWAFGLGGARMHADLARFMVDHSRAGRVPLPLYEFQHGYRTVMKEIDRLVQVDSVLAPEFSFDGDPAKVSGMFTVMSNETYLRVNSLVQLDRLSMHYSIESRTPLADAKLVELMLGSSLRSQDLFAGSKARLRDVAPAFLPADVIARPKRGFTPPVREWLRAIWRQNREALAGEAIEALTSLRIEEVRRRLARPITPVGSVDQMALRLLTLELWLRGVS